MSYHNRYANQGDLQKILVYVHNFTVVNRLAKSHKGKRGIDRKFLF